MTKRVLVIGAGITGVMSAYFAAKKGYAVTIVDQEQYAGMRTSFANGGQISVSNSEVWTTHSNVMKGIKWMFKKDAPLLFRPWRLDWSMWRWIVKFLFYTYTGAYKTNTERTIKLGLESRRLYDAVCAEEKIKFDSKYCGILHFYKSENYWQSAVTATKLYADNGLDRTIIPVEKITELDPNLKYIQDCIGATFTASDWTGDIHKFCYELMAILEKKYQVVFHSTTKVDSLAAYSKTFDAVVVSAGVGSEKLANGIGDRLDVYPVKGYSITINNVKPPAVSLLDDEAKIVTSSLGNRFRVAGTAELAGENYDITRARIEPLLNWVHENFPDMNTHDYSQWACLRPMTPNMMPIVKQSDKNQKVFYNTGHGHLGWTLAPVTAKQVVELIEEKL